MIYKTFLSVVSGFLAVSAMAQNLDPTVVVDRSYEGKLIEVHKPSLEMAVPDSVYRFDLDFDYSVFDNPYKGSYEFQPYLLSMKPSASADAQKNLFIKAGAGYQLHPELDLVWSPALSNRRIGIDVYAGNRSYIGKYLELDGSGNGPWSGHDVKSTAGADLSFDLDKAVIKTGAGYNGLIAGRPEWKRSYNAVDAFFSLASKNNPYDSRFHYGVDVAYRHAGDRVTGVLPSKAVVSENVLDVDASFGFATRGFKLLFDLGADFVNCTGAMRADAGQFHVTPHYVYRKGRLVADLGLKVAKILDSDVNDKTYSSASKEQYLYPDVNVDFLLIRNALKLNIDITGGNELYSYGDVLERNHFLDFMSGFGDKGPVDFTIERVNASIGLEGRISSRFSYNLRAGFASYANAMFDYVLSGTESVFSAGVGYSSANRTYAEIDLRWKSESIMAYTTAVCSSYSGKAFSENSYLMMPAAITGELGFEYNWKRRIFAGIDCKFSSSCRNSIFEIAPFADLGLYAEYAISRGFSLWARGGNLLGMTVCHTPLYAEKGAYFTLGICLNL